MTDKSKLPDLPSDLLELALADLAEIEADPRYEVNMGTWHCPPDDPEDDPEDDPCLVCLAGAVMARTLGAKINEEFLPNDFDDDSRDKLEALNRLRSGEVRDAMGLLERDAPGVPDREVVPYNADYVTFRAQLKALAAELREAGL